MSGRRTAFLAFWTCAVLTALVVLRFVKRPMAAEHAGRSIELDMGTADPGQTLRREIVIEGIGSGEEVADLRPSCACLQATAHTIHDSSGSRVVLNMELRIPSSHAALLDPLIEHTLVVLTTNGATVVEVSAVVTSPPALTSAGLLIPLSEDDRRFQAETTLIVPQWLAEAELSYGASPGLVVSVGERERMNAHHRIAIVAKGELSGVAVSGDYKVEFILGRSHPLVWAIRCERPSALRTSRSTIVLVRSQAPLDVAVPFGDVGPEVGLTVVPSGSCKTELLSGSLRIFDVGEDCRAFTVIATSGSERVSVPVFVLDHVP